MIDILRDKRVLVIGINGQVGRALVRELVNRCELITAARCGADIDLDLSDREQTISVISSSRPDIVINAAAYTQVDMAEDEPDIAHMINAVAPGIISTLCKKYGSTLIHYSTDYVFSGKGNKPLMEDAPVSPVNVYGETKLEGERAIQSSGCDHLRAYIALRYRSQAPADGLRQFQREVRHFRPRKKPRTDTNEHKC